MAEMQPGQMEQAAMGFGCSCLLVLILASCKIFIPACAGWLWLWILCPLWIPIALGFIAGAIAGVCLAVKQIMDMQG